MDLREAMVQRHSVRRYQDVPLSAEDRQALEELIAGLDRESGLHIQLIIDEPRAFSSRLAHYGQFSGVRNYVAMIGPKEPGVEERCGYYGEKLVLEAQRMGLRTCWVALTYRKIPEVFQIAAGERLVIVIAIGYGAEEGRSHRSRPIEKVAEVNKSTPAWFRAGVEAALLAPTAVNQQRFYFSHAGSRVTARAGLAPLAKLDLGIVKYHFELGAGTENFVWA